MSRDPIIVIGAGRSGTSLLIQVLQILGVFTGWRRSRSTAEALFFRAVNRWLLAEGRAQWESPSPFLAFLEEAPARRRVVDATRRLVRSSAALAYLGVPYFIRYRTPFALAVPWGWKDPRNTFTLPIWLELFPRARVLHIRRHGVDVASSLKVEGSGTPARTKDPSPMGYAHLLYHAFVGLPRPHLRVNVPPRTLERAFGLWEEYIAVASRHVSTLGGQALEIRYEELLEDSSAICRHLGTFCEVAIAPPSVDRVAALVNPDRAYAYRSQSELLAFSDRVSARLRVYGY